MEKRIKIGVLGCGRLAQKGLIEHLAQPDFLEKAEVVVLCDATFTDSFLSSDGGTQRKSINKL